MFALLKSPAQQQNNTPLQVRIPEPIIYIQQISWFANNEENYLFWY